MRHNRETHRLGRNWSKRKALLENLVTSLLKYQAIQTTLAKAKAAKRLADHIITLGKDDTVASRRLAFSYLQDRDLTTKLFKEVAPRFKSRNGGYTRILQLSRRKGDGATLALLELTEKEIKIKETKKKSKASKAGKAGDHKGEAHSAKDHDEKADKPHSHAEEHFPKHPEAKKDKPQPGFFRNLGKFFRNKGGS